MRERFLVLALAAVVLLAPACAEIIRVPFTVAQGLFDMLFFWAKAPGPAAPGDEAAPLPLEAAVDRALRAGAAGPLYLVRSTGPRAGAPGPAPFPGAVPVTLPIRDDAVSPALQARLRDLGIPLVRLD